MNPAALVTLFAGACVLCMSAVVSTCQTTQPTKHKHAVHGKAYSKKATKSETPTPSPDRYQNIVNLDWTGRYDEMLYKHGNQLNPPRKPGDREGFQVEGANNRVSNDVIKRYEEMNRLDKQNKTR